LNKRQTVEIFLAVLLGIFVTNGGWWFFLIMLDVVPVPTFSIVATIYLMLGMLASLCGMLTYGPLILYEAWKKFKELNP
jgi:hypothetical protein